jgi:heme exporter protein D
MSPSTQTQASSLYKTSSSSSVWHHLSVSLSLCAAQVHSLLVRKSLPKGKKKKKQNQQQQQQQIAANNLLFFLLHFTKRFPEIDQKTKTKDKTDTKPK